jgi:hypothetical protein
MNAITPIDFAERPILSPLSWEGDRAVIAKAFVAAQRAMDGIKKAASNPAFKTKYADLSHVVEGVVPALNEQGIGVMQFPSYDGDFVAVTTTLLHESGASVTGTLHLRPSKGDPQGCGSAITYARRYGLLAITGCAPEDDDGHAASGPSRRDPVPSMKDKALALLRGASADRGLLKEAYEKNKPGWKAALSREDYAEIVAEVSRLVEALPKDEPPPPPAEDFGIGADDIPDFG